MSRIGWGLVGGGDGSQIGFPHRAAAGLNGHFAFQAGALDADPDRGREFGQSLGLDESRIYANWQDMLEGEKNRDDRIELVTVATPNVTHFEISKAFLEAGFNVFCEKPMTMTVAEARELVKIAKSAGKACAVNYCYSGYPLVREMKAMVESGKLGKIRMVFAEFAGGFMADAADADNPRVRWRFDPKQAGVAAVTVDCGIHALHLATYVTGQSVASVSSDFAHGIESRELEDDNLSAFRMTNGTIGRLWTSGLAIGRTHGLTLQVFGEVGGLRWAQEQPSQLYYTPLNESTRIIERGAAGLSDASQRANHITVGHGEGFVPAIANIYNDLAEVITAANTRREPNALALTYPTAGEGCHSIEVVYAMAESAKNGGRWVDVL